MSDKLSDIGAERAVLAGLLQHGVDGYIAVSDIINHDTFVNTNNQIIYKCLCNIIENDKSVDVPSILAAAESLGVLETINTKQELSYIKTLFNFPINQDNILPFAAQIKKFEFARNIQKLTKKIHKDVEEVLMKLLGFLKTLSQTFSEKMMVENIQKRSEKEYKNMWTSSQKISAISLVYPRDSLDLTRPLGVVLDESALTLYLQDPKLVNQYSLIMLPLTSLP
mgnify:CR=1 FL=1